MEVDVLARSRVDGRGSRDLGDGSGTLVGEVLGGLGFDRDETKWRRCTMRRVL